MPMAHPAVLRNPLEQCETLLAAHRSAQALRRSDGLSRTRRWAPVSRTVDTAPHTARARPELAGPPGAAVAA